MKCARLILVLAVALAGCTQPREPVPLTPSAEPSGAPVVRRPLAEPGASPQIASLAPSVPALAPAPPVIVPPDAIYVCVSDAGGVRRQTAIEFAPKVGALCAKNPEMGPCKYERDICRRSGGRVYAAGGVEITPLIEAEYDKKVMRVRFKSN
jgi:hypothetical protein